MSRNRNYEQARAQVQDRLEEVDRWVDHAFRAMSAGRPNDALHGLTMAKTAIEGAMVAAQWATTLPEPEPEDE
jgi:hypothetical protein